MLANFTEFDLPQTLRLRPYCCEDLADLREAMKSIGREELGRGWKDWDRSYQSLRGPGWVAETAKGKGIGFCGTEDLGNGVMLFHSDLVHKEHQRGGIGTALVLLRLATLDGERIHTIGLLATQYSRGFYERFGFELEGEPEEDPLYEVTLYRMVLSFGESLSDQAWDLLEKSTASVMLHDEG